MPSRTLLALCTTLLLAGPAFAQANVRLLSVDPTTNLVVIKNFGDASQDISTWRLCSLITYTPVAGLAPFVVSGDLDLSPGEEVTVEIQSGLGGSLTDLNDTAADLGLYVSNPFSLPANMVDFTQWGSGGNGRESVAVTKGIWGTGDFVALPAPYSYTGTGTETGVAFWTNGATGPPQVPIGAVWLGVGAASIAVAGIALRRRQQS